MSTKAYGVSPASLFSSRARTTGRVLEVDRWLARTLMKGLGSPEVALTLWDDKDAVEAPGARYRVMVGNRGALLRLIANPLLYFGDEYSSGSIDVDGDLVGFLDVVQRSLARPGEIRRRARPAPNWRREAINSLADSRQNIHHHYDLGNDFYRLWLCDEMVYTCAYYPTPAASLEQAQLAKMELVCRKLRLKGGERVIEAGCGWGSLARYMARHYGARVSAYNISREQVVYARQRAKDEGLEGIEYIEDDYRNITGECDVFVSVGMLEHVGPNNYRSLGEVINRTLTDKGIGLIHTIGQNVAERISEWIEKRIFPGGYPPTLREMMEVFEPYSLSVLDVENLRLHYARTLEQWLERFDQNRDRVSEMFDESFVRAWRLYLAGSIAGFTSGGLQLFQVVFSRQQNNAIPWSREDLFRPGAGNGKL
jgi:cyclopropane-fatty-acyl-phospholipid synthase